MTTGLRQGGMVGVRVLLRKLGKPLLAYLCHLGSRQDLGGGATPPERDVLSHIADCVV